MGDIPVYIPEEMSYPDSSLTLSELPNRLAEGVATTGFIPYGQPFPIWLAMSKGIEQALAVNVSGQGIVLITGCGHMGLEALLLRAEKVFDAPVVGIVGGLHYGNAGELQLQPEIAKIEALDPVVVALSPHDSDKTGLDTFEQAFPEVYQPIVVGQSIRLTRAVATP